MKFKKVLIAILLVLIPSVTAYAAFWPLNMRTQIVKWTFDVSKKETKASHLFKIRWEQPYTFALQFDYTNENERDRLRAIVEGLDSVAVPVHIKISRQIEGATINPPEVKNKKKGKGKKRKIAEKDVPLELIYEETIITAGAYAWGQTSGYCLRKITEINLKPGIYRVEVNTIEDRPEFAGKPSFLRIGGSQVK